MAELSFAAKLLACRLCRHARPHCEKCCKSCTAQCNGCQSCYYDLSEKELLKRSQILIPEEEPMKKQLPEVPVSAAEKQDPALHMEMETLRGEREDRIAAEKVQVVRERLIAQTHEAIGRIQAAGAFRKLATVAELVWLKELKEAKVYRDLPGVGTWETLCKYLGKDRRTTDEDLQNLAMFGEDFLETSRQLSIGYREMRQLRQLTYDGESFQVSEDGKTVIIEGESITLGDADAAPELEAALEKILTKNKTLSERNKKLEKDFKGAVKEETNSLETEKKALLKEVQRLKAFDPEEKDREWSVEQMETIEKATIEYVNLVQKFIIDPRIQDDRQLQAQVSGHLQNAELALYDQRQRLDDIIGMFRN